jgi:hydrogenase nickel incorporation protein HypA/HybF
MHEAMVAQSLLVSIQAEAQKQNARPVRAKISCGMLNAINDDVLTFAFEAVSKGTVCEAMKIEVIHKPMGARCKKCGRTFGFEIFNPVCTACGSGDFELSDDAPLILETIEFETD